MESRRTRQKRHLQIRALRPVRLPPPLAEALFSGGEEGAEAVDLVLLAGPAEDLGLFYAPFKAVAELEGLVAFCAFGVAHFVGSYRVVARVGDRVKYAPDYSSPL